MEDMMFIRQLLLLRGGLLITQKYQLNKKGHVAYRIGDIYQAPHCAQQQDCTYFVLRDCEGVRNGPP